LQLLICFYSRDEIKKSESLKKDYEKEVSKKKGYRSKVKQLEADIAKLKDDLKTR
jgi:hypothetical protein